MSKIGDDREGRGRELGSVEAGISLEVCSHRKEKIDDPERKQKVEELRCDSLEGFRDRC